MAAQTPEERRKAAAALAEAGQKRLEQARRQREANKAKAAAVPRKTLQETRSSRLSEKKEPKAPPLVGNQNFRVYFGSTLINFARVSNVQSAVEYESLSEGGLNYQTHVLTKPATQSGTLTLEKGVSADASVTKIMQALPPGQRISVPVIITLDYLGEKGWEIARNWGFEDGMVTRWELGNLDGMGSEVIIEKLEISHAGLVELEV